MRLLKELVGVPADEKPFVDFESSMDDDSVVAGYVPVKSTLDVLAFLAEACAPQSPTGRAIICYGTYGSGKSRLCAVLGRLFNSGFDDPALISVWQRLAARGQGEHLTRLRQALTPGKTAWRPWLVVPMYEAAGGGSLTASLTRALLRALRRAGLDETIMGSTVYQAAAERLGELVGGGFEYTPTVGSPYTDVAQLTRALVEDLDDDALAEFKSFHKRAMVGVTFEAFLADRGVGRGSAEELYREASANIQQHGFDGIVIIWDEFGFAVESLLKDAAAGVRDLSAEAMDLQNFLQRACGSSDLGRRVVMLGFTHVSIDEYGARVNLGKGEQNRLETVSARFRKPDIAIRLNITETEGYHLIAGMLRRTEAGSQILGQPLPRLQAIAERMAETDLGSHLDAASCYSEIAAPCYPLHPVTVTALLLLSGRIAQENRTAFYYLQNRDEGGLAGVLETREVPPDGEIGSVELVRVGELFPFFEEALSKKGRRRFEQFEDSLLRLPSASEAEEELLRTILVLSESTISPTTGLLSLALTDCSRDEEGSEELRATLQRLSDAGCIYRNEATDVWGFPSEGGGGAELEAEVLEELSRTPTSSPAELLLSNPHIQGEIIDRLGDYSLMPAESGIVRRVGIQLLNFTRGVDAIDETNPAKKIPGELWRAAMVYVVLADSEAQLRSARQLALETEKPNVYFMFPELPVDLDTDDVRMLIAMSQLMKTKDAGTHGHEVLENRLTKLRRSLRGQLDPSIGNRSLKLGTSVVAAGSHATPLEVSSWDELRPAVATALDSAFNHQIRIRCGSFNEWQVRPSASALRKVIERILRFDESPEYQDRSLGFSATSQESALVEGVLFENKFLQHDEIHNKWTLTIVDGKHKNRALGSIWQHLARGSSRDKPIETLFNTLIEPPFGIPNGIIPVLVALVLRTEGGRTTLLEKKNGRLHKITTGKAMVVALSGIATSPKRFFTRYESLSGKTRVLFRFLGPCIGVAYSSRDVSGDKFYDYCKRVRAYLVDWAVALPEGVLSLSTLLDSERALLKTLRHVVPPDLGSLGESLLGFASGHEALKRRLVDVGPGTERLNELEAAWTGLDERVEDYAEGLQAPVQRVIERILQPPQSAETDGVRDGESSAERLLAHIGDAASADAPLGRLRRAIVGAGLRPLTAQGVAAALADADEGELTDDDYGRALGTLETLEAIVSQDRSGLVVLPDGEECRAEYRGSEDALFAMRSSVQAVIVEFQLTVEEGLGIAILSALGRDHPRVLGDLRDGSEASSGDAHVMEGEDDA